MIYLVMLVIGIGLLIIPWLKKRKRYDYLEEFNQTEFVESVVANQQAVDLRSLADRSLWEELLLRWSNFKKQLGTRPILKLVALLCGLTFASIYFNRQFLRESQWLITPVIVLVGMLVFYRWLQGRERKMFETEFPDALNMMTSAVSAGESIMHAILYVGNTLEGDIGREFRIMGKRLQLGESPDDVFRKSCRRYPYPSFYFFVITLRANMQRGGQLKEIMMRLNRMMFNARSIEKKKMALTSEARTSAKIVAAIPFFFLFILQYLSPENFEFVMFDPDGKVILYYVLISEVIGIAIVWGLMKSVR
ncbi:type II secretion system F family protein [Salinivibrio kushneri]|uniref:type II secretion system F family protein n=1 Tax=Salinivibrio kushneri TaxID=1908198 RepID=UPI000988643D|nr:type II secretion system F family protein [Salinivibrio kushneri]OOE37680.1 pilus assembly protein TadB [Salinivibrio kushneri]OOE52361.1 pilus assembly protein TadB [Salinivibrio kushneri]